MGLLYTFCGMTTDNQFVVCKSGKRPPIPTQKGHNLHAACPRCVNGPAQINRVPTRGKYDQQIAFSPQTLNLTAENCVVAKIISNTGQCGRISNQCHGRQRSAVPTKTAHQLLRHVQCLSRTAAISRRQELPTTLQTGDHRLTDGLNRLHLRQ